MVGRLETVLRGFCWEFGTVAQSRANDGGAKSTSRQARLRRTQVETFWPQLWLVVVLWASCFAAFP